VIAEGSLGLPVDLADLLVEHDHFTGERGDHRCDRLLSGDTGVLSLGGLHGGAGQGSTPSELPVPEPLFEPPGAEPADGGWCLVAGEEDQGAVVAQVEGALEGGEDSGQKAPKAVDGSGAVADQVGTTAGEQRELDDGFVAGPDRLQIAEHAGLVGDDVRVASIGLTLAAVASRRPVNGPAGDVEHLLVVVEQKSDDESGPAAELKPSATDTPRRA
jgi:hypothetical protein